MRKPTEILEEIVKAPNELYNDMDLGKKLRTLITEYNESIGKILIKTKPFTDDYVQ